jgi:hypothetical protein
MRAPVSRQKKRSTLTKNMYKHHFIEMEFEQPLTVWR